MVLKAFFLFLVSFSFFVFCTEKVEEWDQARSSSELQVRKRFPKYRVYYNHRSVAEEVQSELEKEKEALSSNSPRVKQKSE